MAKPPPRPKAAHRPSSGRARPRPAARRPRGRDEMYQPPTADPKPAPPAASSTSDALPMVPIAEHDQQRAPTPTETEFWERPVAPAASSGATAPGTRPLSPSAPSASRPAAPPPGRPVGASPGMPTTAPPGMAGAGPVVMGTGPVAVPVASHGIQGPVAQGPVAEGPGAGYAPSVASAHPSAVPKSRAQSQRVFVLIALMVALTGAALVATAGLTVWAALSQLNNDPVAVAEPVPEPAPVARRAVDTGVPASNVVKRAPKPKPKPKPRKTKPAAPAAPKPAAPAPAPAPAAPAPAVGPGPIEIRIPADQKFTAIEILCEISGYRQRASFVNGKAVRDDVPGEPCKVVFKGGLPVQHASIRGGERKQCSFNNGVPECFPI